MTHNKLALVWKGVLGFFILGILISSCNKPIVFDQTKDIDEEWIAADKISFIVEIKDTLSPFDFYINLRNSVDYNFSNLFLFVKTTFPNGRYAIDTVNIWLADPKGKWLGSGIGKYRDNKILFKKQGRFPMGGNYRFEFEQAMRQNQLQGISSLGIRIENSELKE